MTCNGILVGKPQDEAYYQEYKDILIRVIDNEELPIVYNVISDMLCHDVRYSMVLLQR